MGIAHGQGHGLRFSLSDQPDPTQPINQLIAHYAQPIVPMGQVKMGRTSLTWPIDDPFALPPLSISICASTFTLITVNFLCFALYKASYRTILRKIPSLSPFSRYIICFLLYQASMAKEFIKLSQAVGQCLCPWVPGGLAQQSNPLPNPLA